MDMASNIRYYREKAGMYQSDLGRALGVTAQAVSKWELGKAEPDRECIIKMCKLFDITADQLIGSGIEEENEVWQIRESLRRDPDFRILFDTAAKAKPEHLRAAAAMLKALEKTNDEY